MVFAYVLPIRLIRCACSKYTMETVFDKITEFRESVQAIFPKVSNMELLRMADHVSRYKEGSRKYLSEQEMALRDFLLRRNLGPRTLITWLRVLTYPRHLQDLVRRGELSTMGARKLYGEYRKKTDKKIEEEIIEDIQKYIDKLTSKEFMENVK